MQIHSHAQDGTIVEFTAVKVRELEAGNRFDSEYYSPIYIKNKERIIKKDWKFIGELLVRVQYGLSLAMNEEENGEKILKMDDIMNILADDSKCKYVPIDKTTFAKYQLKYGDILFNRVNSEEFVGRTGIYLLNENHTFASYLIRLKAKDFYSNFYITAFLNSDTGKLSLRRVMRRAVNQANINAQELKKIQIPVPSSDFQKKIETLIETAFTKKEESEKLYDSAEEILLKELGLQDYKPKKVKIELAKGHTVEIEDFMNVKSAKEVREADRLDAEYYLPEYEDVEKKVEEYKGGYTTFSKLIRHIEKGKLMEYTEEESEDSIPYILIGNLRGSEYHCFTEGKNGVSCNVDDILIVGDGSKSGEVGTDIKGAVGSTLYTMKLRQERLNKYALLNILKMYFKKLNDLKTGSGVPHLDKRVLIRLKIPFLNESIQNVITKSVQQSKLLKKESQELLERVKRAVEVFIEEDEEAGMKILKSF